MPDHLGAEGPGLAVKTIVSWVASEHGVHRRFVELLNPKTHNDVP